MSIRWRRDGTLVCGAKSEPMEGDAYIDDNLQYRMSIEIGMIVPDKDEATNGLWHWTYPVIAWEQRPHELLQ